MQGTGSKTQLNDARVACNHAETVKQWYGLPILRGIVWGSQLAIRVSATASYRAASTSKNVILPG